MEWMKEQNVDILGMQKSKVSSMHREAKQEHIWYFGGANAEDTQTKLGAGFVINNSIQKHVLMVCPVNDRIMILIIAAHIPLYVITAYAPQSACNDEEKDKFYEKTRRGN